MSLIFMYISEVSIYREKSLYLGKNLIKMTRLQLNFEELC